MKMYEAVKKIKRLAPKEKLIIKTKEGLTSNEKKTVRNHSKIPQKTFFIQMQRQCRTYCQHRCQHYSHHQK